MKFIAVIVAIVCLVSGCYLKDDPLDPVIALRNQVLEGNGCTFTAVITADYEDRIYTFTMECSADSDGNLTFTVTDPGTISGISGIISNIGGTLTFDDNVLAFPLLADGQLTPVSTPWIFYKTLLSGYISACGKEDTYLRAYFDDSFDGKILHQEVLLNQDGIPIQTEICWNECRILSAQIRNFTLS